MKRLNNLYAEICSLDNLVLAEQTARKGKANQYGVQVFDKNPEGKLIALHEMLINKTYKTSPYKTFEITDPKKRTIFCLPYYPDRIAHHAIMRVLEKPFTDMFTADTYSCIKGRGIHGLHKNFKKALTDVPGTQYCLKMDVKKFYPNITHRILKHQLRRKFKDQDLHWLLDGIIDSASGVPIGNYLSQYFANFYLTPFDHWIKEQMKAPYYFRYSDDMILLHGSKDYLHWLRENISEYLQERLLLSIKPNWRIFPVKTGVDVVGYVYRHEYVLLRKTIKQSFARAMTRTNRNPQTLAAYMGLALHGDCKNLIQKLTA